MNFINKGPNLSKGNNVYDIAVVDAVTLEEIAYYTGYYNIRAKKFKLYPNVLMAAGRGLGYKMEKQTINENQLVGF
jgi:endonuclease III-like uncharacterized protein